MASTPKQIKAAGYIPNVATTAYTVAATVKQTVVKEIDLYNSDVAPIVVTINFVPSGGSASAANAYVTTIQAGEEQRYGRSTVMNTGDFISWAAGSANKIVGMISGIEYT